MAARARWRADRPENVQTVRDRRPAPSAVARAPGGRRTRWRDRADRAGRDVARMIVQAALAGFSAPGARQQSSSPRKARKRFAPGVDRGRACSGRVARRGAARCDCRRRLIHGLRSPGAHSRRTWKPGRSPRNTPLSGRRHLRNCVPLAPPWRGEHHVRAPRHERERGDVAAAETVPLLRCQVTPPSRCGAHDGTRCPRARRQRRSDRIRQAWRRRRRIDAEPVHDDDART